MARNGEGIHKSVGRKVTLVADLDFVGEKITDSANEDERVRVLGQAFKALSSDTQKMIYLYFFEGYSQSEIAKSLNLSRAAVSQKINRGVKKLRKNIDLFM